MQVYDKLVKNVSKFAIKGLGWRLFIGFWYGLGIGAVWLVSLFLIGGGLLSAPFTEFDNSAVDYGYRLMYWVQYPLLLSFLFWSGKRRWFWCGLLALNLLTIAYCRYFNAYLIYDDEMMFSECLDVGMDWDKDLKQCVKIKQDDR